MKFIDFLEGAQVKHTLLGKMPEHLQWRGNFSSREFYIGDLLPIRTHDKIDKNFGDEDSDNEEENSVDREFV